MAVCRRSDGPPAVDFAARQGRTRARRVLAGRRKAPGRVGTQGSRDTQGMYAWYAWRGAWAYVCVIVVVDG